ncbi:MAG TPA: uracil-DNA glycosylase [Candidatus Acidoferrales bacterium]|nr:uracil-DNA glycosylase [Candidatus Acidoferrales bacterium]
MSLERFESLTRLNEIATRCELCPRLTRYRQVVARKKKRQFQDWTYWGKPLPGFGDRNARLLILGLAPAAHGGNRTGRMFTGDGSAQFLMAALHRFNFANQSTSESVHDGLELKDAYMTAIVRCAPPRNKPSRKEIQTCERYWTEELRFLPRIRVVLALGRIAFDAYVRHLRDEGTGTKGYKFYHGAFYTPSSQLALVASYHPSRQNTQTRKLTPQMLDDVLIHIQNYLKP